jgi:hypothetical protein
MEVPSAIHVSQSIGPKEDLRVMKRRRLPIATATMFVCVVAACWLTTAPSSGSPAAVAATSVPGAFAKAHFTASLRGLCPNPLIVQTDWLPEADHGFLYEMIGGGGTQSQYKYEGPLGSTGIKLEILSGGPGLGNGVSQPSSLYVGNPVKRVTPQLAFVSTNDAIQFSKQYATTQIFTEYAKSPQVIMFDPDKYHISSLSDLKVAVSKGAKIYVSSRTESYVQWLIGQGVPSSAFVGGYAGDLEKFVGGGGSILNQGYSTNEVYTLEHLTPTWDKPVGYVYLADLGFHFYQSAVSVATNRLSSLTPCLKKLVPIMQHALIDYVKSPTEVDHLLAQFNSKGLGAAFWHTPTDLDNAAAKIMLSQHLVADTPGTGIGGFHMQDIQKLISSLLPIFKSEGITSLNSSVKPSNVATNKFIDPSVGLS